MNKYKNIILNNIRGTFIFAQYSNILKTNPINVSIRNCQNQKVKCWKCGVEKKSIFELFCNSCKIIQQPGVRDNYFKILGIEESYDIDLKSLTARYRQLQGFLHPDKYSNKSDEEKHISEDYSSIVNRAYNTLQSPINRGLHLLDLRGQKIDENEDKKSDKSFLMEIMELNEEVEEAKTPEELLNLNKKNRKELENIAKDLSEAFKANDIKKAKQILIRMKYYVSISIQINTILRERGIVE